MDFLLPQNGKIDQPINAKYHGIDLNDEPVIQHEPLLICNSWLDSVEDISMFPTEQQKFKNRLDSRPSFDDKLCGAVNNTKKTEGNLNVVGDKPTTQVSSNVGPGYDDYIYNLEYPECTPPPFTSGKADPIIYFANIDVESALKRIDYADNKCFVKNYNKNRIDCHPQILDKDYRVPVRIPEISKCINFQKLNTNNGPINDKCSRSSKLFRNDTKNLNNHEVIQIGQNEYYTQPYTLENINDSKLFGC